MLVPIKKGDVVLIRGKVGIVTEVKYEGYEVRTKNGILNVGEYERICAVHGEEALKDVIRELIYAQN